MDNKTRNEKLSIDEVLSMCVKELNAIAVPVEHTLNIGMPIARVVHNLDVCIQAYKNAAPVENEVSEQPATEAVAVEENT